MPDNDLYVIAMPISFTLSEDTTKLYNSAMFLEFNARTVDYLYYNRKEDAL